MSAITEEQRKRMEENRLRALEKRKANSTLVPANKSNITSKANVSFQGQVHPITTTNNFYSSCTPPNPPTVSIAQNFYSGKKDDKSNNANSSNFSKTSSFVKNGNAVPFLKGTCMLLSRQRFYVNVGYNKELIDIFKAIPSKLYDAQTKKWNFLISDHDKVLSMIKQQHPAVVIAPLHKFIIKTFSSATTNRVIKEHDLSVLDPHLLRTLLPFQVDGVNFGIQHNGRVLIADDMGLGKTIQAIAITNYYSKDWPLLVVTPSSVRYTWEEAFHTWLPSLDPAEVTVINSGKDHIPNNKVILISYDLLSRMKDTLVNRKFKSIIVDESHLLKNHKTARTKAFQEVIKNISRIIMLTGTPALSRPIELYTQISALQGRNFLTFQEYGSRYCNGKQSAWGWDYSGSSNMEELQILLEEIVMIRRLKSEVIKQLPPKFRQMVILDPSKVSSQDKTLKFLSRKMKEEKLTNTARRGALMEYFHQTAVAKLKAVLEYVVDLLEADKKFICFAHHQSMINGLCEAIEDKKIGYIKIDGNVSSEQRKHLCDKFQISDSCKVAVLSITSANCGITLTAASLVVFAELFWNPGILTQAEDRAHRIGQEDSVVVQYLVAKGTADDEIWPLVQRKLDILNKAGLSKDNFKSADTIIKEDSTQPRLENFWEELNDSLELYSLEESFESPEKRQRI